MLSNEVIQSGLHRRCRLNKGFAIAGVPRFAESFVQGGSSVLRMKFSANNPRQRKLTNRYAAA